MGKRVAILTAMHGRHQTVQYCLNKMKDLDVFFIYGYSDEADGEFLRSQSLEIVTYQAKNSPLSDKFQKGVEIAKSHDFDIAIMLGSDDYIDQKFLDYVIRQTDKYEHIGFKDIYFEEKGRTYYWPGYTNYRRGEASGAGKTYTREALEKLNWTLYDHKQDKGLDRAAHMNVVKAKLKKKIASIKSEGLTLVDVKDAGSLTPLSRFEGQLVSN